MNAKHKDILSKYKEDKKKDKKRSSEQGSLNDFFKEERKSRRSIAL